MKTFIETNKLVAARKLEVIGFGSSNGVNLERYNPAKLNPETRQAIQDKIQFDPALYYFLSVGRIVHDKGMDELLGAFIRLYQQYPHTRLILVGAFEDEVDPVSPATRQLMQTHPGVILAGWSNAVEYYMSLAQVLVHPSHREGFPNVLMQAGAMGCPVVCSAIDGNRDIVRHNETGWLFDVQNEDALYTQLLRCLQEPQLLKTMADRLLHELQTRYDIRVVQAFLRDKYLQLLANQ